MTAELRFLWSRLNGNYWFYPAVFAAAGLLLALAMIAIDRSGWADFLTNVEEIVPARQIGRAHV